MDIYATDYGMSESGTAAANATALASAINAAVSLNARLIVAGNYNLNPVEITNLSETSNRLRLDLTGATLTGSAVSGKESLLLFRGLNIAGPLSIQFPNASGSTWSLVTKQPSTKLSAPASAGANAIVVDNIANFVVGRAVSIRQQRIFPGQNRNYMCFGEKNRIKSVTPGTGTTGTIELELPLAEGYLDSTVIKSGTITAATAGSVTLNDASLPAGWTLDQLLGSQITVAGQSRYVGDFSASGVVTINCDPTADAVPTFSSVPAVGSTYTIQAPTYVFLSNEPHRSIRIAVVRPEALEARFR